MRDGDDVDTLPILGYPFWFEHGAATLSRDYLRNENSLVTGSTKSSVEVSLEASGIASSTNLPRHNL
jgi:hypothetical protein